MGISDWINIVAIVLSPVIAVLVAQVVQDSKIKRNDRMEFLKILMADRGFGWSAESAKCLNSIEIEKQQMNSSMYAEALSALLSKVNEGRE